MNTARESLLLYQGLDYCRVVFPQKYFPNGQNLSTELGQLDEKKDVSVCWHQDAGVIFR